MSLFKNKVGRPTNKSIERNKRLRILAIIAIVIFVLGGTYMLIRTTFSIIAIEKHTTVPQGMNIKITSNSASRPLLVANKSYSPGTWIPQQQAIGNTVFIKSSGKTKINVQVVFTKQYFDLLAGRKYYLSLAGYNRSGKKKTGSLAVSVQPMNFTSIKDSRGNVISYTKTLTISVDSNISLVKVITENKDKLFDTDYVNFKVAALPTVTLKSTSGSVNSEGVVKVATPNKEYQTKVTIKNPSRATLWYRWVKYKNHELTNPDSFDCAKITSTKTVIRGLKVTENTQKRAGYVRVYTSEAACRSDSKIDKKNDTTGNIQTKNYVASAKIKYQLKKVYNAGDKWYRLRFNYDNLKKEIGNQLVNNDRNICYNYALSYGTFIINGDGTYTKPLTNVAANYGAKKGYYSSAYNLYTIIKSKINNDTPVSIHVSHRGGQHWVLVTGYKTGGSKSNIKNGSDLRNYLYVLDPWDSEHKVMSEETLAVNLHYNRDYVTW